MPDAPAPSPDSPATEYTGDPTRANIYQIIFDVLFFGTIVAIFVSFLITADRETKWMAVQAFAVNQKVDIIPNILGVTLHLNRGAIADIPIPIFVIVCVTVIVLVALVRAFWNAIRQKHFLRSAAFTLIFAGALSNLFDRLSYGYVIDWLLLVDRSVVNLADIAIFFGVLLYLLSLKTLDRRTGGSRSAPTAD